MTPIFKQYPSGRSLRIAGADWDLDHYWYDFPDTGTAYWVNRVKDDMEAADELKAELAAAGMTCVIEEDDLAFFVTVDGCEAAFQVENRVIVECSTKTICTTITEAVAVAARLHNQVLLHG